MIWIRKSYDTLYNLYYTYLQLDETIYSKNIRKDRFNILYLILTYVCRCAPWKYAVKAVEMMNFTSKLNDLID